MEFQVPFYQFKGMGKRRCNTCAGKARLTIEDVAAFVMENSNCKFLSEQYSNNESPLLFECRCGREFVTTFKRFKALNKRQCDSCTSETLGLRFRKSHQEFEAEVDNLTSGEFEVVGEYSGRNTKVSLRHLVCGNEWEANPSDFISKGSRCPHCKESKGERAISKWLDETGIKYRKQIKLEGCRNKRRLPFDFGIYSDENLVLLIEYDGVQHFDRRSFGGKNYEALKTNDQIKDAFCRENGISLLRIPYTELKNVEHILYRELAG